MQGSEMCRQRRMWGPKRNRLKHVGRDANNLVLHWVHGGVCIPFCSASLSCMCLLHQTEANRSRWARNVGIKKPSCQAPRPPSRCGRPPQKGGPDSDFGVAPAQVRSGQVRQRASPDGAQELATETALKSRAVNVPASLPFLHRPSAETGTHPSAQPTFFLGAPSSIIDHLTRPRLFSLSDYFLPFHI